MQRDSLHFLVQESLLMDNGCPLCCTFLGVSSDATIPVTGTEISGGCCSDDEEFSGYAFDLIYALFWCTIATEANDSGYIQEMHWLDEIFKFQRVVKRSAMETFGDAAIFAVSRLVGIHL